MFSSTQEQGRDGATEVILKNRDIKDHTISKELWQVWFYEGYADLCFRQINSKVNVENK